MDIFYHLCIILTFFHLGINIIIFAFEHSELEWHYLLLLYFIMYRWRASRTSVHSALQLQRLNILIFG
jgi:hypothetical protein